jgi:hypothetical protein
MNRWCGDSSSMAIAAPPPRNRGAALVSRWRGGFSPARLTVGTPGPSARPQGWVSANAAPGAHSETTSARIIGPRSLRLIGLRSLGLTDRVPVGRCLDSAILVGCVVVVPVPPGRPYCGVSRRCHHRHRGAVFSRSVTAPRHPSEILTPPPSRFWVGPRDVAQVS